MYRNEKLITAHFFPSKTDSIMHRIFIIFTIIVHTFPLYAQEVPVIDSLRRLYNIETDTSKAVKAFELAAKYFEYNLAVDSIIKYAELGIQLSDKYGYKKGKEEGFYRLGLIEYRRGNYRKGIDYIQECLEIVAQNKNQAAIARMNNTLGVSYWQLGDLEKALNYFLTAAKIAETHKMQSELSSIYVNIGMVLDIKQEQQEALPFYRKALSYIKYLAANKQDYIEVSIIVNMTASFSDLMQYDSAMHYAQIGIKKAKSINYTTGEYRIKNVLGSIALEKKDYKEVIDIMTYLERNINLVGRDDASLINIQKKKAIAYYHLGQVDKAIEASKNALAKADSCESFYCKSYAYEAGMFINKQLGNFEQAFFYQEKFHEAKDSLLTQEKELNLQNIQALYEDEKKERALAELNRQTEAQAFQIQRRNLSIIGITTSALLLITLFFLINRQRLLKKQQSINEVERKLLRLQMNPHFLFNALASIQTFLLNKQDTQKAIQYLSRFAALMRQILEYSRESYISLEEEIKTLENYLAIQQLRYNHQFDYEIEVEKDIDLWETMLPPLIAQPFVENAIEHGKVHTVENGKIKIRFQKEGKLLKLFVEDNGIGREQALQIQSKKKHKSLSTTITKDRMILLSQFTKRKFSFEVKDLPQRGTQVIFQFPLAT